MYTIFIIASLLAAAQCQRSADELQIVNELSKCDFTINAPPDEGNRCIKPAFQGMWNTFTKGRSLFGIPTIDPMFLKNITFEQAESGVNIKALFKDANAYGLSSSTIDNIEWTPESTTIKLLFNIPKLRVEAQYVISGNILLLPIEGDGDVVSTVENLVANVDTKVGIKEENGKKRLAATGAKVSIQVGKTFTELTNLFDGDPILDETVHHFLNSNNFVILREIEPLLNQNIAGLVNVIFDTLYSNLPIEAIFPDGPPA